MENKTLHIVRHGKSSWQYEDILDLDRPLKHKGIQRTYAMAERIRNKVNPELILSSPANRAIHTATIMARALDYPVEQLCLKESLYSDHEDSLIKEMAETENDVNELMIVGHNPTFTNLANTFLSGAVDQIPTSGIVTIRFAIANWHQLSTAQVIDSGMDYPKKEQG